MESPEIAPTVLSRPMGCWELPATLALAFGLSLALTGGRIFDPDVQAKYATNADILQIAQGAESADAGTVRSWWTGGWIQESGGYYRPLASMLFLAEFRAWGRDFQPYTIVSWLCHALSTTLLALLSFRLLERRSRRGLLIALAAALLFNLRRGPTGVPWWTGERLTLNLMPYWPAQTDLFALLFSLLALTTLDCYLARSGGDVRRRVALLAAAVGLYTVALLFKEMAVSLPLLAAGLAWYRGAWPAASPLAGDASRGVADTRQLEAREGTDYRWWRCSWWRVAGVLAAFALPAGLALLARHLWFPQTLGPGYRSGDYVFDKVLQYLSQPLTTYLVAGEDWLFTAAIGTLVIVVACVLCRISVVWLVLGVIGWCGTAAQLQGGNFALITIPGQLAKLGLTALFLGGTVLLLSGRRALLWLLGLWVALIHAPILQFWGPHYLYWPAAFWALFDAALLDQAISVVPKWARRLRV